MKNMTDIESWEVEEPKDSTVSNVRFGRVITHINYVRTGQLLRMILDRLATFVVAWEMRILIPRSTRKIEVARLGSKYGGWWVPAKSLSGNSQCYSVGAGEDLTFDLEVASQFGASVTIIDPTPRAQVYFKSFIENLRSQDDQRRQVAGRFRFVDVGLWEDDSVQKFYFPKIPTHVSCSITNKQGTDSYFEAKCYTLKSLMRHLNDRAIDLVKLDIEGAEHKVIRRMLLDEVNPEFLLIEFDDGKLQHIRETTRYLRRANYKRVKIENRNVLLFRTVN